jgi:hypothetical protein
VQFYGPGGSLYEAREDEDGYDLGLPGVLSDSPRLALTFFVRIGDMASASIQSWRAEILDGIHTANPPFTEETWQVLFQDYFQDAVVPIKALSTATIGTAVAYICNLLGLRQEYSWSVIHLIGHEEVPDGVSLSEAGLRDGDYLFLSLRYEGSRRYLLEPSTTSQGLLLHLFENPELLQPSAGESQLVAALLYTAEDKPIAEYVRRYYSDLHRMSDRRLRVCLLEKPPSKWRDALDYWRDMLTEKSYKACGLAWMLLNWLTTTPLDRSQVYAVAKELGLYPDQIPCLVLLPPTGATQRIILPLDGTANEMRRLFSVLNRALDRIGDVGEDLTERYAAFVEALAALSESEHDEPRSGYRTLVLAHHQDEG